MPGYTAFVSNPYSDPNSYRRNINILYGNESLKREKMLVYSLIAQLTDPLNFYAFKAVFYDYIVKGKHSSKVGMIKLGSKLKYLPRYRFEYTPYGPELVYQNYFKIKNKLLLLSFSHSDPALPNSKRFAANIWNIKPTNNLSFNFSGQLWDQPYIKFYESDEFLVSEGFGGLLLATGNFDISWEKYLYGFTIQLGYKSTGFALGEKLDKGIIFRAGMTFKLGNKSTI
jgi:hypothetical protein